MEEPRGRSWMGSWRVRAALGLLGAGVVAVAIILLAGSGDSSDDGGKSSKADGESAAERGPGTAL